MCLSDGALVASSLVPYCQTHSAAPLFSIRSGSSLRTSFVKLSLPHWVDASSLDGWTIRYLTFHPLRRLLQLSRQSESTLANIWTFTCSLVRHGICLRVHMVLSTIQDGNDYVRWICMVTLWQTTAVQRSPSKLPPDFVGPRCWQNSRTNATKL